MGRHKKKLPERISQALAERMLDILRNGRPAYDKNGQPIIGDDGKQLHTPATSADLRAATDWLGQNEVKMAPVDPLEAAMREIRAERAERERPLAELRSCHSEILGRVGAVEAQAE